MFDLYRKSDFLECPFCGENNIDCGDYERMSNSRVLQPVKCLSCKEEWYDTYELVGVEKIHPTRRDK